MSAGQIQPLLQRLAGVYRDTGRVSRDAADLLNSFQGRCLTPAVSPLMENTGTQHPRVLSFNGTVEISYKGNKYNIPVEIFLPPLYPSRTPTCYVRPTPDMCLQENHRHVGGDGMVYMPYLHEWQPSRSNLVEMVIMMSSIFGANPPCYKKPDAEVLRQKELERQALEESRRLEQERQERERKRREEEEMIAKHVVMQSIKEAEEARKDRESRTQLNTKMQIYLTSVYEDSKKEIISDMQAFRQLEKNAKLIDSQIEEAKASKAVMSAQLPILDTQMKEMLLEIEEAKRQEEPPVDDLALPANVHSRQLLELVAKNAAITDCLYYLDKGLLKGQIRLDEHIRQVRQLGRQQFMVRAHIQKIILVTTS